MNRRLFFLCCDTLNTRHERFYLPALPRCCGGEKNRSFPGIQKTGQQGDRFDHPFSDRLLSFDTGSRRSGCRLFLFRRLADHGASKVYNGALRRGINVSEHFGYLFSYKIHVFHVQR